VDFKALRAKVNELLAADGLTTFSKNGPEFKSINMTVVNKKFEQYPMEVRDRIRTESLITKRAKRRKVHNTEEPTLKPRPSKVGVMDVQFRNKELQKQMQ
jgi:hypothetical protein